MPRWLNRLSEARDIPKEDLLVMSSGRDPCNIGNKPSHHTRAKWIAGHWQDAVANRQDKRLYPRDLHYIMLEKDATDPTGRCSWDEYTNIKKCAEYCSGSLVYARVLDYIPFDGVIDKGATTEPIITEFDNHELPHMYNSGDGVTVPDIPIPSKRVSVADTFDEWVDEAVERNTSARINRNFNLATERQQPYYIELWSEKTLPTEVKDTAENNGVANIIEHGGKPGYTSVYDFVTTVNDLGKPGVILWLSDYDPSGNNMPAEVASKVDYFQRSGILDERVLLDRVGLTKEQVTRYDLPSVPIDTSNSQSYQTKADNFGDEVTELNALKADLNLFCSIVEDAITQYRDPIIGEKNQKQTRALRTKTKRHFRNRLQDGIDTDDFETIQEWADEYNAKLDEARDILEDFKDLEDDPRYTEWQQQVDDVALAAANTAPNVQIPEGKPAGEPKKPFYDSALSRPEVADRINDS